MPIHGRGSSTTFTLSTAKMPPSGFSRHVPIARAECSSWTRSTPGTRRSSRATGRLRTCPLRALHGGQDGCARKDRDRATIQRYSGDSVSLRVEAACPGLLVLPDTYFPGWRATVNGRDQPIYPTDGAFRGVTVPEGSVTRRIPLRAARLPDWSCSRSGRARRVPSRWVSPLVAYAEPTSRNAEPSPGGCAALAGLRSSLASRCGCANFVADERQQSQSAGRFLAHTNISPMLIAISRYRRAAGNKRLTRSRYRASVGFVCRSCPKR